MIKKVICGIAGVLIMSMSVLSNGYVASAAADNVVTVNINGNDVDTAASNINGLTYKGLGLLSCNSTSNLLLDYKYQKPKVYNEMLQVLFGGEHPLMNHVKIEMGNDGNNSTGADSCTMRYEDEEADASRSPGFVLAADAKKINPNVKISVLRWEMPAWVAAKWNSDKKGAGYEAAYKWYRETIFDAYEKYGYIPDYINPDKNETWSPDGDFIKWYKDRIYYEEDFPEYFTDEAKVLYNDMKIIASDENVSLNIVPEMRRDKELYDSVDAIGFHYSTGTKETTGDYVNMAEKDDKEVWYSEGCASFSYTEYQENKNVAYGSGTLGGYQSPLAMCDCFVKSLVNSRKTHYIFQPAIGSFYEGSQYDHKELLSAREPWSGNVHYDEAIYLLWHFTKFANTGWENSDNTNGVWRYIASASDNNSVGTEHLTNEEGKPSYATLASPDKKDFSTIIVNNSDKELVYNISLDGMNIENGKKLEVWESKTDSYFQYREDVQCTDGKYEISVQPFSILTVTSLECNGKEEYTKRLPVESTKYVLDTNESGSKLNYEGEIMYSDDFEYADYPADYLKSRGMEPRYMVDMSGAFYVQDGRLVQGLYESVSQWHNNEPSTVVGDHRWMNYIASVDVYPGAGNYAGIVVREQTGMDYKGSGYSLQIDSEGHWKLMKRSSVIKEGDIETNADNKYNLSLSAQGNEIIAYINNTEVASYNDNKPEYFGRVRLFCGWEETYFDNLKVCKFEQDGSIYTLPYATSLIDNASDRVTYSDGWNIKANGNANDWYRSTSESTKNGASFSFKFEGKGIALLGNNGSATLTLNVDGEAVDSKAKTIDGYVHHGSSYVYYGLDEGEHEATVTIDSGKFVLDAILLLGEKLPEIIEEVEEEDNTQQDVPNVITPSPTVNNNNVNNNAGNVINPGNTVTDKEVADNVKLSKPSKLKVKKKKQGIYITFSKVKNADGYVIERAVNKSKFKKIKTIKNKKLSMTDKKVKKKKVYRYRVKAYKLVNGKKVYSKNSKVIKIKFK